MTICSYTKDCYTEYTKEELLKYCKEQPKEYDSKDIGDKVQSTFVPLKALIKVKENIKVLCVSKKHGCLDKQGIDCILIDNEKKETTVQISEIHEPHEGKPPKAKVSQLTCYDRTKLLMIPIGATPLEETKLQKSILEIAKEIKKERSNIFDVVKFVMKKNFPSWKNNNLYISIYEYIEKNNIDSITSEMLKNNIIDNLFSEICYYQENKNKKYRCFNVDGDPIEGEYYPQILERIKLAIQKKEKKKKEADILLLAIPGGELRFLNSRRGDFKHKENIEDFQKQFFEICTQYVHHYKEVYVVFSLYSKEEKVFFHWRCNSEGDS